MTTLFTNLFQFVAFDGEDETAAAAAAAAAEAAAAAGKQTFTQDELNSILAKEKRKTVEAQKQLLAQLEEAKRIAKAGSDEKSALEQQIEDLQKKTMSAEELAKQRIDKNRKENEEVLRGLEADRDTWKMRHEDMLISNELLTQASANKAIEPVQLLDMLRHKIKLVPKVDDAGKPTDKSEARLDFNDLDSEGKPITLNLTVAEAIKRMSELPQYGNLFEGSKTGGLGGRNNDVTGSRNIDIKKIAQTDQKKFRELRKTHPEVVYSEK